MLMLGWGRSTGVSVPIPGAQKLSFAALAKSAGYVQAYDFDDLEAFQDGIESIMSQTGPILVCLKVPPTTEVTPFSSPRTVDIIDRFRTSLRGSASQ